METQFVYCKKGEGLVNEDFCGYSGHFAWVIDGATDVFQRNCLFEANEVCRYVSFLNSTLHMLAGKYKPDQLVPFVSDAVSTVFRELDIEKKAKEIPEYMLPTYSMAVVAAEGEKLFYFILGDCFISFQTRSGIRLLIDERIDKFSKHNRALLKEYYAKNKQMPESLLIYQETRAKANAPDGYPIGSVQGSGISNAVIGTVRLTDGQKFLICSDGFLDYFRLDDANIERFFSLNSVDNEISAMKAFLTDEKRYYAEIRPKRIDDCTLMLLEI